MKTLFINRNTGAHDWAKKYIGTDVEIVETFDSTMVDSGDVVIGVLPLFLIEEVCSKGVQFNALVMDDIPEELRGKSLTMEDMESLGAYLQEMEVKKTGAVDIDATHDIICIFRHSGAEEWLKRKGIESGVVRKHFTDSDMDAVGENTIIIGVLPIGKIAEACRRKGRFISIDVKAPPKYFKQEMTADEMELFNAKLVPYDIEVV